MDNQKEAEQAAVALRSRVDSIVVCDQASHDLAQAYNKQAYESKKAFHAWFDPIDDASKKQRQATIAQGKLIDDPLDYAIKLTGSKCAAWIRAEKEKAEQARREAEKVAMREAEEQRIREAEALADAGLSAAAEAALEAPVTIAKVVVSEPIKDDGVSYRDQWSAECVDLMTLVKAVASGSAPLDSLAPNSTWLNQWARLTKGAAEIPGVKVTNTPVQSRRL